jgi:hypothetical protein
MVKSTSMGPDPDPELVVPPVDARAAKPTSHSTRISPHSKPIHSVSLDNGATNSAEILMSRLLARSQVELRSYQLEKSICLPHLLMST